jgi:hypothetical protein
MPGTLDRSRTSARPSCGKRKMVDERRFCEIEFIDAVEYLRQRSAELESSKAKIEASRFKGLRARVLSAALQEHINEIQAKVTTPKSSQNYSASTVIPTSPASFCPMDIGVCPPATTYVISYAHTFENHQILQRFHTVTI